MTQAQFIEECAARTIEPGVAIENEAIQEALRAFDDAAVIAALDSEF